MDGLRALTAGWTGKLQLAWELKKKQFQDDADEAMRFFDGPYDWLYKDTFGRTRALLFGSDEEEGSLPAPTVQMTVNKVAELVQLFGPALYHRNPNRRVIPRKIPSLPPELYGDPNDPYMQQFYRETQMQQGLANLADRARAALLEYYLNYTPSALDLKDHARWMIDEAIIKGMGVLWPGVYRVPAGQFLLAGSFYDSVDNLLLDPDAEALKDIKWCARRRIEPAWKVEREYGLPSGSLERVGSYESAGQRVEMNIHPDGDYRRKQGRSCDLVVYWEIWSVMGPGGHLSGVDPALRQKLAGLGDYVYLVICESLPYPLNLPPPLCDDLVSDDPMVAEPAVAEAQNRCQWPTPFWADGKWPFVPLYFHPAPRRVWPVSHIKPAMGELMFLNWAWSFLAGKVKVASRDFLAILKSAGEELKERIRHGPDYTILEVDALHQDIDKVVRFLQHPGFNPEIYKVIEGVTHNFERRTGLTELMYGQTSRQIRSAQEANVKADAMNLRPDEMANRVEDTMSAAARQEAFVARWHLRGQDVLPVLGQEGVRWWEQLLVPTDPSLVLFNLEYRVEAGTARKPNKAMETENMQQAVQMLFSPLWSYAQQTGDVAPINALIADWAKSVDLDASKYLLQPPPPPPPPPQGAPQGPPPQGAPQGPQGGTA